MKLGIVTALGALLLLVPSAWAEEPADGGDADPSDHPPIKNRFNLRVGGASTDDTGFPTICLDVAIAAGFGVESCGTGQAILHNEPGNEMERTRRPAQAASSRLKCPSCPAHTIEMFSFALAAVLSIAETAA